MIERRSSELEHIYRVKLLSHIDLSTLKRAIWFLAYKKWQYKGFEDDMVRMRYYTATLLAASILRGDLRNWYTVVYTCLGYEFKGWLTKDRANQILDAICASEEFEYFLSSIIIYFDNIDNVRTLLDTEGIKHVKSMILRAKMLHQKFKDKMPDSLSEAKIIWVNK